MGRDISLLGISIEEDIKKHDLRDLLDLREKNMETFIDNVPGLSFFNHFRKMYNGIQDYFMMKKVATFMIEISSMSAEARINLIDSINSDPVYGQKFGTFLIAALDRHDFEHKSIYLARVCKYYENGYLTKSKMVRFKGLIEQIDLEDLVNLKYNGFSGVGYPKHHLDVALYQFQALGLTRVMTGGELTSTGPLTLDRMYLNRDRVEVAITTFGTEFIQVINDFYEFHIVDEDEQNV
jgi:hypothetical protein